MTYSTPAIRTIATNGVDGLLNALDDKRLEVNLHQAAKAHASAQFKGGGGGGRGGGDGSIRLKEHECGNAEIKASELPRLGERATKANRADKNKDEISKGKL
eukprot:jgi/Tetstr1/421988/TSEL_001233.t2